MGSIEFGRFKVISFVLAATLITACGGGTTEITNSYGNTDASSSDSSSSSSSSNSTSSSSSSSSSNSLFIILKAYNGDGNTSVAPTELSTTASSGETVTLSWESPVTNSDGTCLTDLQGYRLNYGSTSRFYDTTVDIDLASSGLSCVNTGSDACGNIQTCTYSFTI